MISLADAYRIGYPNAVASAWVTSHSAMPVFGGMTGRTRLIRRSALVNVPSFSRNDVPGKNTCANLAVSVRNRSWTMTHSIAARASSTCWVFGSDCARSSPWMYIALNSPAQAALSMFGIRNPGSPPISTPQARSNCARIASSPMGRFPDSSCGNDPISQAPCTLFCPRSGLMPTPDRPMLPVAIARFAIAMTMVEPWLCSVTPRP